MVTSTCPQADDLRSFHLGMLDERREQEVLDHLNACPACEDTVANLEGTADSLVAAVRHSAESQSDGRDDRPALQQALAEIEGLIDSPPTADSGQETASPVSERIRDYELLGTLGEGGMGTVYRARHTRLDRQVALKLLPARRLRDNAAVARFEREMKAIGRLDHPTIVRATDAGDVDGTHFLAMDYVEGIDLSKLVRLVGPLDVPSACEIVRQAALGLDYAHQQDLIHRDVKPSNLMLTLRGEVRILDLGLALFGAASEALDELTTVGQLMGTLDYMAPEQGDNSHDVDARADVYSLGATLFKLLTATAPYDSPGTRTPLAKMKALATIDAPSVADRRDELPAELVTIVDRALLRNVDDRFASAKELADSLIPFCEGHVLSDLAECGRDLALREDEQVPQPPTLPPFVQKAEISASPANVTRAEDFGVRPPGVRRRIATWMLVPLILLAGIIIWIQTDNGTLVVESPSGDIPIEIRTGGKFHRNETLSVGKNELTIRSGTYEIVLPKEYDSLKVENQVFTLERGGEWIARISKKNQADPPGEPDTNFSDVTKQTFLGSLPTLPDAVPGLRAAQPGSSPKGGIPGASELPPGQPGVATLTTSKLTKNSGTLVFSGKTFEEWQRAVLTERNPEELEKAVQALCILGRNNRDAEAAATVLRVVEAFPCEIRRGSSEAELVASSIRYLRTLDATSIVPEVARATRSGGKNTRELILKFLAGGRESSNLPNSRDLITGNSQPLADRLNESETFHTALLDVFVKLNSGQRYLVFPVLYRELSTEPPDPRLIPFLRVCIQHSEPDRVTISAAARLAELQPTSELADVFLNHLEGTVKRIRDEHIHRGGFFGGTQEYDWWDSEANAWLGLAALGHRASKSVDRIARLIDDVPAELAKPQTIYLMASPSLVKTRFEIHRQLLPIEILAMIGPSAKSTVPAINNVVKTLTGAAPNPEGDYGLDGFHEELVLERIVGQDARTGVPSPEALPADVEQIRDRPQRLDSALVAIRRITGQPARFGVS
ncbi:MAG: protein kinase domain-containing protein, partial [Planctomycetales bacterium]